jgi:alkylhydroperoxidase family enzyme
MKFGSYFLSEGKLDTNLRELATLRAAYLCRAPYEPRVGRDADVETFLNAEEIVELTMVTSFYNMVARTLNALQVEIDAPAQKDMAEVGVEL